MKKILLSIILIYTLGCQNGNATNYIHASGSYIIGVCGDTIILRGINYAAFNWGIDITDDRFAEIAQSGANCVRIPWYSSSAASGGHLLYDNLDMLDSAIAKCVRNKMIPIVVLMDNTCDSTQSTLITLSNFYLQPGVLSIIHTFQSSLIIDIANEALYHQWSANTPAQALTEFENTYKTIITNFRNANVHIPLMIDAPDCGTDLTGLTSIAPSLQTFDTQHNLIFSAHAYWYGYANNDSTTVRNIITSALSQNVPIVLGEVANLQDGTTACMYPLLYKQILNMCEELKVNWLSWSWDNDVCPSRQITNAGLYASLTTYGNDILNNPVYGISSHSKLTTYLSNKGSCTTTGITENSRDSNVVFFPNPMNNSSTIEIHSSMKGKVNVYFYDVLGQKILTKENESHTIVINRKDFSTGLFFYRVSIEGVEIGTGKFEAE